MATPIPPNRAVFTAWELAASVDGDLTHLPDDEGIAIGVTTDSRAIVPGNAFVALRGDSFDGHAFVAGAAGRGAAAVVVERGSAYEAFARTAVIEVADTTVAYGRLARCHLRRWRRRPGVTHRVAALTGSAGKTTTKELVRAILAAVAPCYATPGNLNNRIGVPAAALAIHDEPFAVFELGMSLPGEIAALTEIVEPDVAALLNVGVAHAEGFRDARAGIAREKGAIFERLRASGVAVVNADDAAARAQLLRCDARYLTFGATVGADVRIAERVSLGYDGSRVTVERAGERFDVEVQAPGAVVALDVVAAVAIADATAGHAIEAASIVRAVGAWRPPAGRSVAERLAGGILVVDDTYNANPASLRAAVANLVELRASNGGRAIVVLGEMRELGALSEREHEALGRELAERRIDLVIGCGGKADVALRCAEADGTAVRYAVDAEAAGHVVADEARAGDVILFKGSRGAAVERALAILLLRHPRASTTP